MDYDQLAIACRRAIDPDIEVMEVAAMAARIGSGMSGRAAVALYGVWLEMHPDHPMRFAVLFNQAALLADLGDLHRARDALQQAADANPAFMPALLNLGRVYERLGLPEVALRLWAIAADRMAAVTGAAITQKITAHNQAARVQEAMHDYAAAEIQLRQSLDLDPTQRDALAHFLSLRQRQCKWPVVIPTERIGPSEMTRGLSPLSACALTDDPVFLLALAGHSNQADVGMPAGVAPMPHSRSSRRKRRLRIGYLSSDMRSHAIGHLMAEVFALHDPARVEVFAYYCGPAPADGDILYERLRASADHWVPVSDLSDQAAAQRIRTDAIDILVDVNGYTCDGRYRLVASRPAPVIVNWLGYPGTLASPYHHYIIADDWIIPPGAETYFSEKVLRLPCYQPNDRQRVVAPSSMTRAEAGLPDTGMVYCCFNATHKITRPVFDRWLVILGQVPGSVLWLLDADTGTCQRLRDYAEQRGIAAGRIIFAVRLPLSQHLARHTLADLFLDTFPYGAHTTASDCLWMGTPILTLSGRSFASRVCGSLVRSAGLPELVCLDADAYVQRAVALGHDRTTLSSYRVRLLAARDTCVLFDTPLLVRRLEELYQSMWHEHEAGTLPRPDLRNLDVYLELGAALDYETMGSTTDDPFLDGWRERLEQRHALRAIAPDDRLCRNAEAGCLAAA